MNCSTVRVPGSPSAVLNRSSNTIARGACLPGTGLLVLIAMLIALAVLMVPAGAADTTSDTSITTAHNATVTTGTVVPTVSITTIPTTTLASLFSDDRESINVVDQGVSRTYTPYEEEMATVSRGSDAVLQNHYLSSIKTGNLAGTAWPKFQNNLNNTGTSPYNGPHIGNDVWTYTTGDLIRGQPVIGADGTIYLGSYDKKLYAFNPDGSVKWSYTTGNQIVGSAAIGSGGTVYIGSYDTKLYAINPDGTLNWSYTTGNRIFGSPAIGSDGTVYVGSRDKNLYALNPDGTLKWRYTTGHQIFSSAAIGADGTIYTGSLDNKLYALNPDGTLKWSYLTGNQIYGSPTIGTDGTIYTGSLDNKLYALNPDGTLKWSYTTGNQIYGSPALGSDGTIYIGSYDNKLYALNPDGTLKWSYTTGNPILGSAVIGADGIIYIGSLDNKLYALNPDGSLKWSYSTGNQIYGSAAIGTDGTLYIGSFDSTLYAFRDAVPVVKFTSSSTGGEAPLSVQFTDLSKGNITARLWDFGDSQTSTEKNPAHTYLTTGSYTVNLTVTGPEGTNSTVKSGYITVNVITGTTLPLINDKNGTVSGGLYVGSFQPVPFASQPATGVTSRDFDQPFTVPAFTNIQWAKVYVNVYSMSGSRDIPSRTTTSLDGNGDGTYETVLGVEEMTSGSSYSTDGKVYWINDHTNRVYSDYETSYDVTNLITSSHPAVHVKNEKTGTEYDGRLKAVTLVVAYNDGDSDTVKYWVNHGHDWFNAGSSSTTFGTAGIPTGFTDATLNNVALSSADGTYTFNSVSQAGANPVAPINYYENHTWSVTGAVNPATDSVFQYALGTGSSFKTTLAALAVRYPGTQTPSVQVQVVGADGNPLIADRIALEGGAVPLNVTNMSSNRFSAVPAGTYQLTVTKAGHISVNTTIHYAAGTMRDLTATLVPHAYQPTVILAENGVSLAGMTHAAPERMNALRDETDQYNLTLNGGGVLSVALEYPMRFQLNQPQVTSALPVVTEIRNGTFEWTNPEYSTTNATIIITTVPAGGQSPLELLLIGGKLGDVYYNGQVTSTDSLYILHYVVGNLKSLPTYDYADISRDGKVTSTDALYILHYIVGNVNEYYQKV